MQHGCLMTLTQSITAGGVIASVQFEVRPEAFAPYLQGDQSQWLDSPLADAMRAEVLHRLKIPEALYLALHQAHEQFSQGLAVMASDTLLTAMVKGEVKL